MEKQFKNYFIVGVAVFTLFIGFWYVKTYARSVIPVRTFSVQGEGKVVAIPDIAEVHFSVLTEGGKDLAALQMENTEKGNLIIAFLKENGVDKKDIKTQSYRINPRYESYSCAQPVFGNSEPCPPPKIVGYSISQDVLVKVRDLSVAGSLLSGIVNNGANTVSGPNFTIDEPEALKNEAREEAVENAREKAKTIARAGRFRLGKPVSIYEGFSGPSPRYALESFGAMDDKRGSAAPAPTIEPGSEDIVATVSITYEIR